MDTHEQPPRDTASQADFDQATHMASQPTEHGSLILEDIGVESSEEDVAYRKKGKVGPIFWASVVWLGIVAFCAVFRDFLPVADPYEQNVFDAQSSPLTNGYLLGADANGRDVLARLVYGARVSVVISVAAVLTGSIVGGSIGLAAGYIRGRFESLVMGIINTLLAFPGLILLLLLVAFLGQNLPAVTAAVAFLSIPIYTRVARATTLAVSQREFVLAAKAMGAKRGRILFREIAPNVALPVAAFGLIALGTVILLEGTLAFLGLSVQPPTPTWGGMINEGRNKLLTGGYHLTVTPALVLFFTVFSLNYVGDSLRNMFDVRESQL